MYNGVVKKSERERERGGLRNLIVINFVEVALEIIKNLLNLSTNKYARYWKNLFFFRADANKFNIKV